MKAIAPRWSARAYFHINQQIPKLKIITYNVNGLRAAVTKGLPEWINAEQPDVLCIQETKLQPEQHPAAVLCAGTPVSANSGITVPGRAPVISNERRCT